MNNTFIIDSLTIILNTYLSMRAYFYQRINQTVYTNQALGKYVIDYTLLLPSSEFIFNLNESQVNAQIQEYIDICNVLVDYLTTNVTTQTNLFFENIQNQLNYSITQINGFSVALLRAEYANLFTYTVPYDMSLSVAMYLNNINFNTYNFQVQLNATLGDLNNIRQNVKMVLSK
jgi:hypothetical protein